MSEFIIPNENDVLCGKGSLIQKHPGNINLRSLVDAKKDAFMGASADKDLSKRSIAEQIIHNINSLNPAGRFLIEDPNANNGAVQKTGGVKSNVNPNLLRKVWTVVDDEKAIEKVMHRLRERKKGDANATEEAETPPTNDNALKNDIDNGGDMGQQKLPPIDIGMHHNDEAREQTISPIDLKMLKNIEEQPFDDDFLSYFDIALDDNTAQRQAEESTNNYQQTTSLLQWVERSDMQSPKFIKMALQIALKLTECISEDEQGGHNNNMIPLDSINSDNVQLIIRSNGEEGGQSISVLMNSFGESSAVGALLDRLYALGVILYEIFSGETLKGDDTSEIALAAETEAGNSKPRKRLSLTTQPTYMATLEGKGLPWSILLLLQSLLECRGHGEEIGDNAYTSFSDLKHDLCIMLADPSRFVDNIQVTSRLAFPTLEICDKLYGRENEIAKLDELYQQYIKTKAFKGVMISGMAGVGKSRLALHTQQQSIRCNGYFAMSKFESKQMSTTPLATIGSVFNTLCELLANGSTATQLESIEKDLDSGLGRQAGLLAGVVPNLAMLLPSSANAYASSKVVNVAASMSYLFVKLLWVISIHSSRPITVLIDDIQFADPNSLILIGDLLQSATKGPSVFFVFCHRVDKDSQNEGFIGWQKSISNLSIECMRLDNLRVESVNSLVSETLHITPRITRSLSNILHHKSRGNALFLKQLIGSMYWKGYIFFEMTQPRWNWDLGKIAQYPISSSVLSLLMKTMKELGQLHSDLQLGLGVASCFGSSVKTDVLDMLSHGLGVDLAIILEKALEKGFMIKVDDEFHFVHDKIQQAAYELKPIEERRKDHMQYGLLLHSHHTLHGTIEDCSLFFTFIHQMNYGGPAVIDDSKRSFIADLNLKAGMLCIKKSDFTTAYKFIVHGISYLSEDCWTEQYELSLKLYDAAAEAASFLQKNADAKSYTDVLIENAKSFEDSLQCRMVAAFCLEGDMLFEEAFASLLIILNKLQEKPLRRIGDVTLIGDIEAMNKRLQQCSDNFICNMPYNKTKHVILLQDVYKKLYHVLQFYDPSLIASAAYRMVESVMSEGMTPIAPIAFVLYGTVLTSIGRLELGCRLGRLALKLVEKDESFQYKSCVIAVVHQFILLYAEPLQAIASSHVTGFKFGEQLGDILYSSMNLFFSNQMSYLSGQNLINVQGSCKNMILTLITRKQDRFIGTSVILYHHIISLAEGLHMIDAAGRVDDDMPTVKEVQNKAKENAQIQVSIKIYQLIQAILFRRISSDVLDDDVMNISKLIEEKKMQLRPIYAFGIFYEGLTCFLQSFTATDSKEKTAWIDRGRAIIAKVGLWLPFCNWNWENKQLLLEAMEMHTLENHESAELLYIRAIQSSHKHYFIHEEGISSELAGDFFFERGNLSEAYALYMHSIKCFNEWGAAAVSKRVQNHLQSKFGHQIRQLERSVNVVGMMGRWGVHESTEIKKRQLMG